MSATVSNRVDGGSGGGVAAAAATANSRLDPNAPPPFLSKTYDIVDDPATDDVISWGPQNNSFVVWNQSEFSKDLLPKYFKHSNFSSFVRQLNTYGFRKVTDKWEFANEGFLRGQKHLLKNIYRRKPSHAHNQAQLPQAQNASISACVEVGKFGLDEEIERLKRDKNVLMQELVRLRQQQQVADNQLQTLGKRLQGMERRQQMMMSFFAKAMQSPGLFAQLVQQNESGRRVVGVNKKRRLPRQSNNNMEDKSASPDGQIIEYRPLDPLATMVAQMLKFDPSTLEPLNNSDGLLVDNFSSPEALDGRSSSSNPGIAEAPQSPGFPPSKPVSSSYSTASSSSAASEEIQSVAGVTDVTMPDAFLTTVPEAVPCEFSEIQGMIPDGSVGDIPVENFIAPEQESIYLNQIATEVDGSIPVEGTVDALQLSEYIDSLLASEDFIIASPQSGEATEEVVLSAQEAIDMEQAESGSSCNNARYMDNLTTQMGLLTSDSQSPVCNLPGLP